MRWTIGALMISTAAACGGVEDGAIDGPDPQDGLQMVGSSPSTRLDAGQMSPDAGFTDAGTEHPDASEPMPEPTPVIEDGPNGFIGSPCQDDQDCGPAGAICLTDGHPRGMCTLPCDRLCPDQEGHPVTFCSESELLRDAPDGSGAAGSDGACHARCDFGLFPASGCRPGYGCSTRSRASQPGVQKRVCVPGEGEAPSSCLQALAELNVPFEPTIIADRSPSSHPGLTCHVEDPVVLHPPIHGVDIQYFDGSASPNVYGSCEMALSLVRTIDDVRERGVTKLFHVGTYVCRTIRGTNRLSRHAHGDAIDIWGFEIQDGTHYTLIDNWEHDTSTPVTTGARFLFDAAHRWHDNRLWNVILTPNYNAAHDNHFHVDLTPGSDSLRFTDDYFIGPAPYAD